MAIFNELVLKEAVRLYSDLLSENPVIPLNMSVFTYGSIDGNGAFEDLQMYIGSDITFDLLKPFPISSTGGKLIKSVTMSVDYSYDYTVTSGDISALTANLSLSQVLVNNSPFPASISYSAFPFTAGDIITVYGLPDMASVSSLKLILE